MKGAAQVVIPKGRFGIDAVAGGPRARAAAGRARRRTWRASTNDLEDALHGAWSTGCGADGPGTSLPPLFDPF